MQVWYGPDALPSRLRGGRIPRAHRSLSSTNRKLDTSGNVISQRSRDAAGLACQPGRPRAHTAAIVPAGRGPGQAKTSLQVHPVQNPPRQAGSRWVVVLGEFAPLGRPGTVDCRPLSGARRRDYVLARGKSIGRSHRRPPWLRGTRPATHERQAESLCLLVYPLSRSAAARVLAATVAQNTHLQVMWLAPRACPA